MTSVETKRHPTQFYLTLVSVALFCIGVAALTLSNSFAHFQNSGRATQNDYLAILFSLAVLFIGLYTILAYARNAPQITADTVQISFNKQDYYWKDIQAIELTGYQPFYFLFTYPQPGARLTFKNGKIKYIYDNLYSNTYLLKWFIQQAVINKQAVVEMPVSDIDLNELKQQNFEEFKRSQFFSFYGIVIWLVLAMFLVMLLIPNQKTLALNAVLISFPVCLFLLFSYGMNYFCLSDKYLVVKNNNFFWKQVVYPLAEITEVHMEYLGKGHRGLRIKTKHFRSNIYPATLLTEKQFNLLLKALKQKGVSVKGF